MIAPMKNHRHAKTFSLLHLPLQMFSACLVQFPKKIWHMISGLHRTSDNRSLPDDSMPLWNLPHELIMSEHVMYGETSPLDNEGTTSYR